MGSLIKFFFKLFFYNTKGIVRLVPRKRHKWVFGANGGFRDNPKFLFLATLESHPEIRPIWVARKREVAKSLKKEGYEAYYWLSPMGLYHSATSQVFISDHSVADINQFLSEGAFYVNLWHGSSVKRVRWQAPELFMRKFNMSNASEMRTSFKFKVSEYAIMFRKPDLCLAPSTIQLKEFFAPMMDIPEDNCVVGIYPRSRLMIEGKEAAMQFIKKYESDETLDFVARLSKYSKTYIYMPTWRNDGRDFIEQADIDWKLLNDVMKKNDELFILKLHPFSKLNLDSLSHYSNICLYPKDSDVYTMLPFIDCLITDYSSIYTDFLMMNKEIVLFVFDYKEYVGGSYELSEFDKYFVGKRAYDFNSLLHIIISKEDCHVPHGQYDFLMNFYWDNNRYDIDIVEEINNRLGK